MVAAFVTGVCTDGFTSCEAGLLIGFTVFCTSRSSLNVGQVINSECGSCPEFKLSTLVTYHLPQTRSVLRIICERPSLCCIDVRTRALCIYRNFKAWIKLFQFKLYLGVKTPDKRTSGKCNRRTSVIYNVSRCIFFSCSSLRLPTPSTPFYTIKHFHRICIHFLKKTHFSLFFNHNWNNENDLLNIHSYPSVIKSLNVNELILFL